MVPAPLSPLNHHCKVYRLTRHEARMFRLFVRQLPVAFATIIFCNLPQGTKEDALTHALVRPVDDFTSSPRNSPTDLHRKPEKNQSLVPRTGPEPVKYALSAFSRAKTGLQANWTGRPTCPAQQNRAWTAPPPSGANQTPPPIHLAGQRAAPALRRADACSCPWSTRAANLLPTRGQAIPRPCAQRADAVA